MSANHFPKCPLTFGWHGPVPRFLGKGSVMRTIITLPWATMRRLQAAAGEKSATHNGTTGTEVIKRTVVLYLPRELNLIERLRDTKHTYWLRSTRLLKLKFIVNCLYWFAVVTKGNGDAQRKSDRVMS